MTTTNTMTAAELNSVLDRGVTAPYAVELHLSPDPEFTRKWGKKVKAAAGRYSDARGDADRRYVTLPWTAEGRSVANSLVQEYGVPSRRRGDRKCCVVIQCRGFRGQQVPAGVEVQYVSRGSADPMADAEAGYNAAFLRHFPDAGETRDPEGLETLTRWIVREHAEPNMVPVKCVVGRRHPRDADVYFCKPCAGETSLAGGGGATWSDWVPAARLHETLADAWQAIASKYAKVEREYERMKWEAATAAAVARQGL